MDRRIPFADLVAQNLEALGDRRFSDSELVEALADLDRERVFPDDRSRQIAAGLCAVLLSRVEEYGDACDAVDILLHMRDQA